MTALEKLLASYGRDKPVELAAIAPGSTPNPPSKDVTDQPTDTSTDEPDPITDEQWDALQTTLSNNAPAVSTAIDLAGKYSDMQAAVSSHDEIRLSVASSLLRYKASQCYTSAEADAAVNAAVNAAIALLNRQQPDGDEIGSIGQFRPVPMNW